MAIVIKPSDLFYKYARKKRTRGAPKFVGKPDPHPFDRDDLYEVIPLLAAVMDALGSCDGRVLRQAEEIMVMALPSFIISREEVFDYLVAVTTEHLDAYV